MDNHLLVEKLLLKLSKKSLFKTFQNHFLIFIFAQPFLVIEKIVEVCEESFALIVNKVPFDYQ